MPSTLGIVASGVGTTTPNSTAAYRSHFAVQDLTVPVDSSLSVTQANLTSGGGAPASGDIVLMMVMISVDPKQGGIFTINTPTGFTAISEYEDNTTPLYVKVFRRTATASEGTYTATLSSGSGVFIFSVIALVVKNAVGYDAFAKTTSFSTSLVTPSNLVTTANNALLVHCMIESRTSTDFTNTSANITDVVSTGASGYGWMHAGYETGGAAGTQTSRTVATGRPLTDRGVISVAIK